MHGRGNGKSPGQSRSLRAVYPEGARIGPLIRSMKSNRLRFMFYAHAAIVIADLEGCAIAGAVSFINREHLDLYPLEP